MKKDKSLNDEQNLAVYSRGSSILVSAPAGSGKTKILVNRMMSLIEDDHVSVDSLLVLTFTKAAALEMKQRLVESLNKRIHVVDDSLKVHLEKQKILLNDAYITNFHSFCSDLLSQYGYTIINFVLVYFVGAYLRVNKITLSKKKAGMWIIRCLAFLYAFSMMEHVLHLQYTATWYYNNPIIILMSAYILLFFMDIHFESKIINELDKAAFTCFLFHEFLLRHIRIEQFVNRGILVLIVHQLGSALIIYLISYIVYKIYHLCSHWFFKLIEPYINKINISVEKG